MTVQLAVSGSAADLSLAGLRSTGADAPLVALGDGANGGEPVVRWLDRPSGARDDSGARLIAPAGEGLWRRAPWPAADALLELAPAAGAAALLAGSDGRLREAIGASAADRGVELELADQLDADALSRCGCVILAESFEGALPARALAVLAARRLLVVPRVETTFGLEDGLDHLECADPDEAVTIVEAYRRRPDAFARVAAWGREKARPHRASVAYARLAEDLRLHGLV